MIVDHNESACMSQIFIYISTSSHYLSRPHLWTVAVTQNFRDEFNQVNELVTCHDVKDAEGNNSLYMKAVLLFSHFLDFVC